MKGTHERQYASAFNSEDEKGTGDRPFEANAVGAEAASAASRDDQLPSLAVSGGSGPDFVAHLGIGSRLRALSRASLKAWIYLNAEA